MTEALVIGSGAAGGWAAKTLGERGIKTTVLEAGPLAPADQRVDRADHRSSRQPVQAMCSAYDPASSHLFVDDLDNPYTHPAGEPFHWFRGRQVGGRLLLWAGVSLRMSEYELGPDRDGRARSWPLHYQDVEPFYARVERFMQISGGGEHSPTAPAPEAVTSRVPTAGESRLARSIGQHHRDLALLSGRVARVEADAILSSALATGNVRIRPNAVVSHIETDARTGMATAVVFTDGRTRTVHRQAADCVVLCASSIETVRILLNSRTKGHPEGLGNNADQLGRYLLDHVAGVCVEGHVPDCHPFLESAREPGFVPVSHIPDSGNHAGRGFRGGYGVTLLAPEVLPRSARSRDWALSAAESGVAPFRMWASGEVLPNADNRVELAAETDAWGVPRASVRLAYGANELAMAAHQFRLMTELANSAGFEITGGQATPAVPGTSVHELGGAPLGRDPLTSVADPRNRLWEAPNVLVTDGSCFPTAGWQNPTLTIMALTARACGLLADDARRGLLRSELL